MTIVVAAMEVVEEAGVVVVGVDTIVTSTSLVGQGNTRIFMIVEIRKSKVPIAVVAIISLDASDHWMMECLGELVIFWEFAVLDSDVYFVGYFVLFASSELERSLLHEVPS
mmetsp:Transcript_22502/g.34407  ORF Transcript_22502/g.34407 Transcript_22502/m.34407 type:complete len:111 (+) Transcript_22502:405-737(+)